MFSLQGCSEPIRYEKYSSRDAEINLSMDYISGWLYSESRGSAGSYAQVIFYEPKREDKNLKAGIVVTVQDEARVQPGSFDISAFADAFLERRGKFKDMEVLSRSQGKLFGEESITLELTYKSLDKLQSADAALVPVKEKIVVLHRGGKFYSFRYINTDREFNRFARAFSRILKTVEFKAQQ